MNTAAHDMRNPLGALKYSWVRAWVQRPGTDEPSLVEGGLYEDIARGIYVVAGCKIERTTQIAAVLPMVTHRCPLCGVCETVYEVLRRDRGHHGTRNRVGWREQ